MIYIINMIPGDPGGHYEETFIVESHFNTLDEIRNSRLDYASIIPDITYHSRLVYFELGNEVYVVFNDDIKPDSSTIIDSDIKVIELAVMEYKSEMRDKKIDDILKK